MRALTSRQLWIVGVSFAGALLVVGGVLGFRWFQNSVLNQIESAEVLAAAERVDKFDIDGQANVVAVPDSPSGEAVVYVHGNNQTERAIIAGPNIPSVTAALLDAGYTVAASHAHGNAWGNASSVDSVVALVDELRANYSIDTVYVMAESMGGLTAFQLPSETDIAAMIAFYPVCDVSTLIDQPDIASGVAAAYPGGDVSRVSPVTVAAPVPTAFWASASDTRVPASENAEVCAADVARAGQPIEYTSTLGNHGDASNFDIPAIVDFLRSH